MAMLLGVFLKTIETALKLVVIEIPYKSECLQFVEPLQFDICNIFIPYDVIEYDPKSTFLERDPIMEHM